MPEWLQTDLGDPEPIRQFVHDLGVLECHGIGMRRRQKAIDDATRVAMGKNVTELLERHGFVM